MRATRRTSCCARTTKPWAPSRPRTMRAKALDHLGFASQLVFCHRLPLQLRAGADGRGVESRRVEDGARPQQDDDRILLGRPASAGHRLRAVDRSGACAADRKRGPGAGRKGSGDPLTPSAWFLAQPCGTRPFLGAARRERQGFPILFHVGGEEKMAKDYLENGLPFVKGFHGGDRELHLAQLHADPAQPLADAVGAGDRWGVRPLPRA